MKRVFLIIVVTLLLLAVPLTVYLTMRNQEIRKKAAPATTLKLSPQTVQKNVGEEFTLAVHIDTGDNEVVAAEVNVIYDPTKVEALTITNGTLFPNILSSGTIGEGVASISVGAANSATPVTGEGVAISITFKAIAATTTPLSIRFDSSTFVGALGEQSINVLTSAIPATITITDSGVIEATPTPTISLLVTPLPTLPSSPTPTPTINILATITPTPSSTPLEITTPSTNEAVQTSQPTIQGIAPPGSTITLTIYSDPITVTVTADSSGNWTYTLDQPITDGPHTIVAAVLDPVSGQTTSATLAFVVATDDEGDGETQTTIIPEAGVGGPMMAILIVGMLMVLTGLLIPKSVRQ